MIIKISNTRLVNKYTRNMPKELTTEQKVELIREVRDRPAVWDPSQPEYSKKNIAEKHWTDIAEKLDFCGGKNFSVLILLII